MESAGSLPSSEALFTGGATETVTDPVEHLLHALHGPVLTGTAFALLKGLTPSLMQAQVLQHDAASKVPRVARVSHARVGHGTGNGVPLLPLGDLG
jgi:hypothetical protein